MVPEEIKLNRFGMHQNQEFSDLIAQASTSQKDANSKSVENRMEQNEYKCFKSKSYSNHFYYKKHSTDPKGNHFYVGYSIPSSGEPIDGALYGHYHLASKTYTFYVFYNTNTVSVKSWRTFGGDRNGIEYLAKVLVPASYEPHEQTFVECN
jgi:hypothetical protein